MKSTWLKTFLIINFSLLLFAPPSWAKAKGYCFVVGYSYKLQKFVHTPIFMVKIRNVSYSDTQYVADMELTDKMESQFRDQFYNQMRISPEEFTVTARGAYKSLALAIKGLDKEKDDYDRRGFEVSELKDFRFSD